MIAHHSPAPLLRRLPRAFASLFLLALLAACTAGPTKDKAAQGLSKDFLTPRAGREIWLNDRGGLPRDPGSLAISLSPKTGLDSSQIIQDIREENLDSDPNLEQIVVYKLKDDQEDLLRVLVIDYDESRAIWAVTWQGISRATNNKTFNVRLLNINGGSLPEIVCQGTNNKGEQTLDIFHISGQGGFPLQYVQVLSISADIGIEVVASSEAAGPGPGGSESPPARPAAAVQPGIVAQSKDLESTSPLDMVQTRYSWKPGSDRQSPGQYLVASTTKIPGATVQETALDQLYKSETGDFEKKYLEGGWIHTYVNQRKKNISQLMFFDTAARTIRLIEGDRLESHEWVSSHKPAYGSNIQVYMINESFHSLKTIGQIQITGLNSLSFALQDRDDWKGDFIRLTASLEEQYTRGKRHDIPINFLVLSGLYHNENGQEVVFDAPRFTWRDAGRIRNGGFLTYQLNSPILELEFIDAKGLVVEKTWYIARLTEIDQGNRQTQKVLELQAAELSINGPRPLSVDPIRLVQAPLDYSR